MPYRKHVMVYDETGKCVHSYDETAWEDLFHKATTCDEMLHDLVTEGFSLSKLAAIIEKRGQKIRRETLSRIKSGDLKATSRITNLVKGLYDEHFGLVFIVGSYGSGWISPDETVANLWPPTAIFATPALARKHFAREGISQQPLAANHKTRVDAGARPKVSAVPPNASVVLSAGLPSEESSHGAHHPDRQRWTPRVV